MVQQMAPEIATRPGQAMTSMAWIDEGGRIRSASGELAGFASLDEFLDRVDSVVNTMPGAAKAGVSKLAKDWIKPDAVPIEVAMKDGGRRLLTCYPHESGGIVCLSVNVSERNGQAERAHEMLEDAIDSLSEGFALYDDQNRLVIYNEKYREMNRAADDIIAPGMNWEVLLRTMARRGVYKDAIGRDEEWVSEHLANRAQMVEDIELHLTDGTYSRISVHPTRLGGFVVTRTDITDMKQAEATRRDSDLLVRKVLDTTSAIVVMARIGDGQILYRSPAAIELFGDHKSAIDLYVNPDDRADYVTEMLVDGRVDDFRLQAYNATREIFPASLSGRLAEYKGEEVIVSHVTDLTEQLETDALIRKVLEACPVPVQMTNAETGQLLFRSPETIALFGETDNAHSYYANRQDRADYLEKLRSQGFIDNLKVELVSAEGRRFWGAVSARLIDFKGEQVIVSNTRDLTDELAVQDELAGQREMLFQNEKLSALGELLAGVAHELNNPLSVVVGHSLMLREDTEDPQVLDRINKISRSAERCAKIVKTFLAMARQRPARLETLDIEALINTAADVAGFGMGADTLVVRRDIAADIPEVQADPEQITQVLINLIINAEQAITKSKKGDRIEIAARFNGARGMAEISITDNGPGIADTLRPRIFEPFFTTKEVGEGTGIGLAFCHRVLHSHEGRIWLDPEYRGGSRFILALPVHAGAREKISDAPSQAEPLPDTRVLVVDDETDVADLIAEILQKDGCSVTHANSGKQALDRLGQSEFDIVLSDLNMPEMDGRGLFEAIKELYPGLLTGLAFITGDTMGPASQKLLGEANRPHLEKPISPNELRGLVQGLMQEREGGENAGRNNSHTRL